ncbi:MAG TPA: porphobilinogen synthase [Bacteroidia bacterium]|nr:porphobilinogen synthase [Bacteroidia bacterium]HNP97611.1 porphobilinogen synthase [Bacteroidia bacterium]
MLHRPRRMRRDSIVREMVAETRLSKDMFIYPYFVTKGKNVTQPIEAMPGIHRFSTDTLLKDAEKGLKIGVNKVLLFGVGEEKAEDAHSAYDDHSIVADAVRALKKNFGDDLYVITDICLCAYTTHGHCGILDHDYVQNDPTLDILARMALKHAEAGADMVAPSDMMDGRVLAIRNKLDEHHFENTALMSYATKFASAYYGPFREAADSAPGKGDRKSYQMDFRNAREAVREAKIDETEGADIVMVKPALAYLDIIRAVRRNTTLPVACYNVSAEYTMVKTAAKMGFIDEQRIVMENMYAFARAGAGIIITYHAHDILGQKWI